MIQYTMTVGLEIHAELSTETKLFCACKNQFGDEANTNVCPICMGFPGALPSFNRDVLHRAMRLGKALGCDIHKVSSFDRKNYFYPDNPNGYQITQYHHPICTGGAVPLDDGFAPVPLLRIHMEEDAGKLIHGKETTEIDGNRCGVPLLEIVSAPAIHSPQQAEQYVNALREILTTLGISDCKMQNGSLRVDVNVSVSGDTQPGTPVEIKNINSVKFMKKAILFEAQRQTDLLSRGEKVLRQTRRFNEKTGTTEPMRGKESAPDYRYFPEPDLPPIVLTQQDYEIVDVPLPLFPAQRRQHLRELGVSADNAGQIAQYVPIYNLFCSWAEQGHDIKTAVGLICGELYGLLPPAPTDETISDLLDTDTCQRFYTICRMLAEEKINFQNGKKLLRLAIADKIDPLVYAEENHMLLCSDPEQIDACIQKILAQDDALRAALSANEKGACDRLIGKVMAATNGSAAPKVTKVRILTMFAQSSETDNKEKQNG